MDDKRLGFTFRWTWSNDFGVWLNWFDPNLVSNVSNQFWTIITSSEGVLYCQGPWWWIVFLVRARGRWCCRIPRGEPSKCLIRFAERRAASGFAPAPVRSRRSSTVVDILETLCRPATAELPLAVGRNTEHPTSKYLMKTIIEASSFKSVQGSIYKKKLLSKWINNIIVGAKVC